VAVSEGEIVRAQARLAEEGVFGQPAAAVPLAALRRLRQQGTIAQGESAVLVVTGSGLKYTAAFDKHELHSYTCRLDQLAGLISSEFRA